MDVTYNGETLCVATWARKFGLSPQAIHKRLRLGWDAEKAFNTPVAKPPSKNDAELMLNDLPCEQLPPRLRAIVETHNKQNKPRRFNKKKHGRLLRDEYRTAFDAWFEEDYLPSLG